MQLMHKSEPLIILQKKSLLRAFAADILLSPWTYKFVLNLILIPLKHTKVMEFKTVAPVQVIASQLKTNLVELVKNVGQMPQQLMDELEKQGITPTGSQIWEYCGCDGCKPEQEFDLLIAVPVEKKGSDSNGFFFTELSEYNCAESQHKGPWSELGSTYGKVIPELLQSGKQISGTCREIYVHCDFENQANCVTNIQLELL